ncbi:tyrosine-protein phosphatase [Bacillus sp. FJAT-22090]|uniref:tyrosine-protein phosphatase n=1 Tax=Bacillus sp. FJAT-22090 TaxID=1581038 RepID=UPI0006AFAEE3|nr:CpsB/CapC family capsule biosynthesis tyrosine phosphatase [Bacillus sp. FJAT-22090]
MLVDIHNHILPGLDDGPRTMEEAILLARNAVANGVTHIIATPHHNHKYSNNSLKIKEAVLNFNNEISQREIPIKILPGQETYFYTSIVDELKDVILPLANSNKYILIELPSNHLPAFLTEILLQIQLKGYKPIIAHPERNSVLRKEKNLLFELVNNGALMQINASSLIGMNGYKLKKYTKDLVNHNLVHFISSDAHNTTSRPFLLKEAYQYVGKKFSKQLMNYFNDNAKYVLLGKDFQPWKPISYV